MATNKNTTPETPAVEEAQQAVTKDTRVEVFIPRPHAGEDPNLFVCVNGKAFLLPRGKKSLVPQYVKDEIERSFNAEADMYEHAAAMASKQ